MLKVKKVLTEGCGILYNCKVGRPDRKVKDFLIYLVERFDPIIVMLQEAEGYADVLDEIPNYTVFQLKSAPDSANLAFLVRNDKVGFGNAWVRTMRQRWWGANNKVWRKPRSLLLLRAVGVSWANTHRVAYQAHSVNRKANEEIDDFLYEYATRGRKRRRCVIGGDINDLATSSEIRKLKARANLFIRSVGGIDFVLYKGWVVITKIFRLKVDGGSDHDPRVFYFKTYRWRLQRERRR